MPTPISSYLEPGSISHHAEATILGKKAEVQLPSFFLQPLKNIFTVILMLALVSACSAGTILGYSEAEWLEALGSGHSLPFPAGARLSELTRLGPGTLLYMALQAEDRQDQDAAKALFKAAAEHETGLHARLAAERYLLLLRSQADGPGLLAFTTSIGGKNLSPWTRASTEAEALSMTGQHAKAFSAWTRLRAEYPEEAVENEISLRSGILQAALALGNPEGTRVVVDEFRALLAMTGSASWYKAMAGINDAIQTHPAAMAALNQPELLLARARVLSGTREYGAAVLAFRNYQALAFTTSSLIPQTTSDTQETWNNRSPGRLEAEEGALLVSSLERPAVSDMARAFLFSSHSEGEAIFALLATQASTGFIESASNQATAVNVDAQTAYLHLFWAGRFARAAERWREAASLFSSAATLAQDAADLDAALWYEAETRSKYSILEAVAVLARAYKSTTNPAYYSDLLEPLSRKALADRSGTNLAAIIAAATPGGDTFSGNFPSGPTPRDRARLDYIGARAVATGLISAGQLQKVAPQILGGSVEEYITAALYRAYRQDEDPWYRLLAAFRLGLPLVEPADGHGAPEPPPGPIIAEEDQILTDQTDSDQSESDQDESDQDESDQTESELTETDQADTLTAGLIRFGLAAKARTELGPLYRELDSSTIRAVAEALVEAGDYGSAIRAIAPLFSRPGYVPSKRDRELYWPQAFLAETRAVAERFGLPEALLFGLVRSESLFQPAVVSRAGAVGLAQLMPATAAETARRLRMAEYDVTNPADNLTLGASYFKRILDNRNGRYMPAIFSYNAGPTRFLRWEDQYGPLPQDLLLEVLDYAETRQYGRNVAAAAMAYAALYYENDLHGFLASLLGE